MIKEEYSVAYLGLFGSYVRNNQNLKRDLDILVEFNETPSILQYIDLENYLTDILGIEVDLVIRHGLKPRIRDRIMKELVLI